MQPNKQIIWGPIPKLNTEQKLDDQLRKDEAKFKQKRKNLRKQLQRTKKPDEIKKIQNKITQLQMSYDERKQYVALAYLPLTQTKQTPIIQQEQTPIQPQHTDLSLIQKIMKYIALYLISGITTIVSLIITMAQKNQNLNKILFIIGISLMYVMFIMNAIVFIITFTHLYAQEFLFVSVPVLITHLVSAIINGSFATYFFVNYQKNQINAKLWVYILYFVFSIILLSYVLYYTILMNIFYSEI